MSNKKIAVSEGIKHKFDTFKRRLELEKDEVLTQDRVIEHLLELGKREIGDGNAEKGDAKRRIAT